MLEHDQQYRGLAVSRGGRIEELTVSKRLTGTLMVSVPIKFKVRIEN